MYSIPGKKSSGDSCVYDCTRSLFAFACLWSLATALPLDNPPVVALPPGASNHGDPKLLCTPTTWKQIALFFASNYLAHAATVRLVPGERPLSAFGAVLLALLYPFSALAQAVDAISRRAVFSSNQLEQAAQAGALCVVARSAVWVPISGAGKQCDAGSSSTQTMQDDEGHDHRQLALHIDKMEVDLPWWLESERKSRELNDRFAVRLEELNDRFAVRLEELARDVPNSKLWGAFYMGLMSVSLDSLRRTFNLFFPYTLEPVDQSRRIHGGYKLPAGYMLVVLPPNAVVEPGHTASEDQNTASEDQNTASNNKEFEVELSSSYNVIRILIGVFQSISASVTIYRTRGDQISRYGYAAFGLTVIPYAIIGPLRLAFLSRIYELPTGRLSGFINRYGVTPLEP